MPRKKSAPRGDDAHLGSVWDTEDLLLDENVLNVSVEGDQRDIFDEKYRMKAAQDGEDSLGVGGGMLLEAIEERHEIGLDGG